MFAIFHLITTPRSNDMFNILHNEGAITFASSISSLFGMLSGPLAFRGFRLRRTPTTSISESWILDSSGIDEVEGKGDLLNDSELLGLKTE
jgi:hypothetical protein